MARKNTRCLWNLWKVFKLLCDLVLFILSLTALRIPCLTGGTYVALIIFVIFISSLFLANSSWELISFNHGFIKKFILNVLTCKEDKKKVNETKKEKNYKACAQCLLWLIMFPFGLIYLFVYITVTLTRLCDIRQCFWRQINYNLNNFLNFLFKLCVYAYSIGVIIAVITSASQCSNSTIGVPIVCLIFILLRLTRRCIYFFFFQIFTPTGLEQAQIILNQNKVKPIRTIDATLESPGRKLKKSKATGEQKRFCFSSNYVFETSFCRFVRMSEMGSMGCISSTSCSSIDLEHIFYCHNDLNIPNARYRCCYDCTDRAGFLIGFHQTPRNAALCIALSPMKISEGECGWFGDGVYFARSFDQTFGKIGREVGKGALIIDMVDMGRKKIVKDQR